MTFRSFKRGGDAGYRTENGLYARRRGPPKSSTPRRSFSPRKALRQPNSMTSQAEQRSQKRSSTSTLKPRKRFSAPLPGPRSRYSLKRSKGVVRPSRTWAPVPRSRNNEKRPSRGDRQNGDRRIAEFPNDDVVTSVIGIITGVIGRAQ